MKHTKKLLFLFTSLFVHGVLLCKKEEKTGFGKTHFVIGAHAGHVSADVASSRLKKILHCDGQSQTHIAHALFCPDDDSRGLLLDLIACEKKALYIAAFLVTDEVIARAIVDAKKRGVMVEVVTDRLCCEERGKADMLHKQGIEVLVYCGKCGDVTKSTSRADIMHNKFIVFESNIFGRSILWTGSFNFTHSARLRNQENVLVLDDPVIVDRYRKQFAVIKTRCKQYHVNMVPKKEVDLTQRQKKGMHSHSADRSLIKIIGQA